MNASLLIQKHNIAVPAHQLGDENLFDLIAYFILGQECDFDNSLMSW